MQDFDRLQQTIASWYGMQVLSAHKVRDAWRIDTTCGPKCFKQVEASPARVQFIAAAVNYVINNGFSQTAPFIKTFRGEYVVSLPEGTYYATEWLPGREGDFNNSQDIQSAAEALARFHQASLGFVPPADYIHKANWGAIPDEWQRHGRQLVEFRKRAAAEPRIQFNRLYLGSIEGYLKRVELALKILSSSDYSRLVNLAKQQGSLCHRDYTYHNFLVDEYSKLYVIDFDYCAQDIRAYDVGRFIRKVAKHHHYQLQPVIKLLESYQSESPLHSDELLFILAFVHFPQRFWRIANRYYCDGSDYSKEHLLRQLEHEINELALEVEFLLQLAVEISRGVVLRR